MIALNQVHILWCIRCLLTPIQMKYPVILASLSILYAHSAHGAESGWLMEQRSKLAGKRFVYLTKRAVKIVGYNDPYQVIARAPDWRVYLVNVKDRTLFSSAPHKFIGRMSFGTGAMGGGIYLENLPVDAQSAAHEKLGNVSTDHYRMAPRKGVKVKTTAGRAYNGVLMGTEIVSADYWLRTDAPEPAALILKKIYRLPRLPGLPVKLSYRTANGDEQFELLTATSINKSFDAKTFEVPKGYKTVRSEDDVINGADRKKQVQNLIRYFDDWRGPDRYKQ